MTEYGYYFILRVQGYKLLGIIFFRKEKVISVRLTTKYFVKNLIDFFKLFLGALFERSEFATLVSKRNLDF